MKWTGRYRQLDAAAFRKDLVSGMLVGIIAIPLGMAFAIASGVKPEYGIYTTIVAGIAISLLGGSRFQIGGPTGAFIPILFAIVLQYGYENLLIAGFLAGIILILMGAFKLGVLIRFIPRPVTVGFTTGIAVLIFTGQIANFLGLSGMKKHERFLPNMSEIGTHLSSIHLYSVVTAAICLATMLLTSARLPKIPGSLAGLVSSSVIAALFFQGHVATIGSSFGAIPGTLPHFHFPEITWDRVKVLIQPAFMIALLGGIESLLSAVVADGMTGTRHDSNRELIGQGIANMAAPLFGGIPATGAIARTATNIKNGAVSPLSGIIHGIVVFLVLLLCAPYASDIPLASMAPILMVVAWNMSERKEFAHILKSRTSDSFVLLITFLLTVLANLTTAVEVGLILSGLLFVKRMSEQLKVVKVLPDAADKSKRVKAYMVREDHDCPQAGIFTPEGPLFFGTAHRFEQFIADMTAQRPAIVLLRMSKVPYLDTTAEAKLARLVEDTEQSGGVVLISGIQQQPLRLIQKTGLHARIGKDRFFAHTGEAIDRLLTLVNPKQCVGCTHAAFRECETKSSSTANVKAATGEGIG